MRALCAEPIGYTGPFGAGTLVRVDGLVVRLREVLELRGWTPYELAHRAGLSDSHVTNWLRRIVEIPGLPVAGINIPGAVAIAPQRDPATRRFVIAHELSHVPAREHGFNDCHADVQQVTLAALMPKRIVQSLRTIDPLLLAAAAGVPYWTAWARLKMPSVLAMLRAA